MRIKSIADLTPKMRQQLIKQGELPAPDLVLPPARSKEKRALPRELEFTIKGKPKPIKNHKDCYNGRAVMSVEAKAWLNNAREQLATQFPYDPIEEAYEVDVEVFYAHDQSWLDNDNALTSIVEALKGVVMFDDSPRYIPRMTVASTRSNKGDYVEIRLVRSIRRTYQAS